MSKHSKKGFRKLENHELSEFTTLKGEESGSDLEMMDHEDVSRREGGACCWCMALYLLLLTCFVVLLTMLGIYFGYNMIRLTSDYSKRIRTLEDKVHELQTNFEDAETKSAKLMEQVDQRLNAVNTTVKSVLSFFQTSADTGREFIEELEQTIGGLKSRVDALESHPPPSIGTDEVNKIRDNMAIFQSHIQSYDSQLEELKRQAGETTHDVTKYTEKIQLLYRNLSSLKDSLKTVQSNHKDTVGNLDLLSAQFSALQVVVQEMNVTLFQEIELESDAINETKMELEGVVDRLSAHARTFDTSVEQMNSSLGHLAGDVGESLSVLSGRVDNLEADVEHITSSLDQLAAPTTSPTEPTIMTTAPMTTVTEQGTEVTTEPPSESTTNPTTQGTTEPPSESTTNPTTQGTTQLTTEPPSESTTNPTTQTAATEATLTPTNPSTETATTEPNLAPATTASEPGDVENATPEEEPTPSTEDANEEGQRPTTSLPTPSSPSGTQTMTDSTEATEDLPASKSDSEAEEQSPPVDTSRTAQQKLEELLMSFNQLDINMDSRLDFQEFSIFAGDGESARTIFQAMDSDHDSYITESEILRAVEMLKQQTTEATNPPVNGPTLYTDGTPLEPNDTTGADDNSIATSAPVPAENTTSTPDGSLAVDSDKISQKILNLLTGILRDFDTLDFNNDNRLSSLEFATHFVENGPTVASMFSYLDTNGDYYVTVQEITSAIDGLEIGEDKEVATSAPNGEEYSPEANDESQTPEEELADYLNGPGGM